MRLIIQYIALVLYILTLESSDFQQKNISYESNFGSSGYKFPSSQHSSIINTSVLEWEPANQPNPQTIIELNQKIQNQSKNNTPRKKLPSQPIAKLFKRETSNSFPSSKSPLKKDLENQKRLKALLEGQEAFDNDTCCDKHSCCLITILCSMFS